MNVCKYCRHYVPRESTHLGSCNRWKRGYDWWAEEIRVNEVVVEDDDNWGDAVRAQDVTLTETEDMQRQSQIEWSTWPLVYSGIVCPADWSPYRLFIDGKEVVRSYFLKWLHAQPSKWHDKANACLSSEQKLH